MLQGAILNNLGGRRKPSGGGEPDSAAWKGAASRAAATTPRAGFRPPGTPRSRCCVDFDFCVVGALECFGVQIVSYCIFYFYDLDLKF